MFGINGGEAIVLILLALFIIGPDRLPAYAEQLRETVKVAKRYATGAGAELKDTLGPELAEVDWRKYDPRQYDPRTIVRQALLEDDDPRSPAVTDPEDPLGRELSEDEMAQAMAEEDPQLVGAGAARLPVGTRAPFDLEAT